MWKSLRPRGNLWLDGFALLISLWCLWGADNSGLVVLICAFFPCIALVVVFTSNGRLSSLEQRGEGRPNLSGLIFMPALALGARAILDYQLIDWPAGLAMAIVIALIWTVTIRLGQRPTPVNKLMLAIVLLVGVGYGYGIVIYTNAISKGGGRTETVIVSAKDVSKGLRSGNTYYFTVSKWSFGAAADREVVAPALYDATQIGDTVCVTVHPGLLRLRWYQVHACEAGRVP